MSTHSYHGHRDESEEDDDDEEEENYDEDENDDDAEEENLSLKPLNAAFRPFHCSFRSDSKFIVPSNTNWFDNQTMSKIHIGHQQELIFLFMVSYKNMQNQKKG